MYEDKQIYTTSKVAEFERQAKKIFKKLNESRKSYEKSFRRSIRDKKEVQRKKSELVNSELPQNIRVEQPLIIKNSPAEKNSVYIAKGLKLPPEKLQLIVTLILFLLILLIIGIGIYLPYSR